MSEFQLVISSINHSFECRVEFKDSSDSEVFEQFSIALKSYTNVYKIHLYQLIYSHNSYDSKNSRLFLFA